jgi:hypothetical protein
MIFPNKLALSNLGQQWMDDTVPPDQWYWNWPNLTNLGPMPDDYQERYERLILWAVLESFWDQCVREPKVSSVEYQFVVEHLKSLEAEFELTFPPHLSCWDVGYREKEFDDRNYVWFFHERFPELVRKSFVLAESNGLLEINPSSPIDDERNQGYNDPEMPKMREWHFKWIEANRVKDIVRVTSTEPTASFVTDE